MTPQPVLLGVIVPAVIGSFAMGTNWARATVGSALGILTGLGSAVAWGLSAASTPRWNAPLNLVAAVLAAGPLGFLAPVERLCDWHPTSFGCR